MELWIRSQDKRQLLKVNDGLFIANDTTVTYIGLRNLGHIGKYTTEERALEILDEIQTILIGGYQSINHQIVPLYKMPKE